MGSDKARQAGSDHCDQATEKTSLRLLEFPSREHDGEMDVKMEKSGRVMLATPGIAGIGPVLGTSDWERGYTFHPPNIYPKPADCIAIARLLRETADEIEEEYTPVRRDESV